MHTEGLVISVVASLFCLSPPWTLAGFKISGHHSKERLLDPHWERLKVMTRLQNPLIVGKLVWGIFGIGRTMFQPGVAKETKTGKEKWEDNSLLKWAKDIWLILFGSLGDLLLYHCGGTCILLCLNCRLLDPAHVPYPLSSDLLHHGKSTKLGVRRITFWFWLCCLCIVWLCESLSLSMCLSFYICKTKGLD